MYQQFGDITSVVPAKKKRKFRPCRLFWNQSGIEPRESTFEPALIAKIADMVDIFSSSTQERQMRHFVVLVLLQMIKEDPKQSFLHPYISLSTMAAEETTTLAIP
jgi:hypothetical protein